jgi:hypothetical protein
MADSGAVQIPDLNQPVLLRGEEGEFASRVEGHDEGVLTLARPFGLPLETQLDDGAPFDVEWTSGTGLHALPVRVTERTVDGKVRLWQARPTGPARALNRRAHVRVPVATTAVVEVDGRAIEAFLLDLSEAAVRCLVSGPMPTSATGAQGDESQTDGGPVGGHRGSDGEQSAGPRIRVRFALSEQEFDLPGAIYRSTASHTGTELIIMLPEDERTASSVRRAVFAEQIRMRQLSR